MKELNDVKNSLKNSNTIKTRIIKIDKKQSVLTSEEAFEILKKHIYSLVEKGCVNKKEADEFLDVHKEYIEKGKYIVHTDKDGVVIFSIEGANFILVEVSKEEWLKKQWGMPHPDKWGFKVI
jgi:beta-galactosidase beta subunit